MKKLLCFLLLCSSAIQLNAKAKDSLRKEKQYKNEIGIMLPIAADAPFNGSDMGLFGVQYRRSLTRNTAYRIVAGWGLYNYWEDKILKEKINRTDTTIRMDISTMSNLAVIGAGVDIQRQFYKKIYFFAAVELKAGYGSGNTFGSIETDYTFRVDSSYINQYTYQGGPSQNTNVFYLSLSPIVGVKLQFRQLSTGLEIHGLDAAYQHISNPLGKYSFISSNDVMYGLFFNYRF